MNETESIVHDTLRLRVDVARQVMEVFSGASLLKTYPVSTSKFGLGSEPGSYKTPLGRFKISEKIGGDAPLRMAFKSRQPTKIVDGEGEEDLILTRILWLSGLDPENANTYERYIYIHGTNQESHIGTPASHGCIRMKNRDIAELFGEIPDGALVEVVA